MVCIVGLIDTFGIPAQVLYTHVGCEGREEAERGIGGRNGKRRRRRRRRRRRGGRGVNKPASEDYSTHCTAIACTVCVACSVACSGVDDELIAVEWKDKMLECSHWS